MVHTPENESPVRSFVGTNPLKHRGAIVKGVTHHVHHAFFRFPQFTIEPDSCFVTHHLYLYLIQLILKKILPH